jgi:hypothetical protein
VHAFDHCPICESVDRHEVLEFTNLLLFEGGETDTSLHYDYVLCRTCAMVYASNRPDPDELRRMYENFDENLGRMREGAKAAIRPVPPTTEELAAAVPAAPVADPARSWRSSSGS